MQQFDCCGGGWYGNYVRQFDISRVTLADAAHLHTVYMQCNVGLARRGSMSAPVEICKSAENIPVSG